MQGSRFKVQGSRFRIPDPGLRRPPCTPHHAPCTLHPPPSTFHLPPPISRSRSGFSLLEVLLATTVLIIIVMLVSLVFQQSHVAWMSGTNRAEADTVLRSMLGQMERDLTHAVDPSAFGIDNAPSGGFSIKTGSGPIQLLTLDGTNRVPLYVEYDFDGSDLKRSWSQLETKPSGTSNCWHIINLPPSASDSSKLNGDFTLSAFGIDVTPAPGEFARIKLPLRVDITAQLEKSGSFAGISGWSAGRDRNDHTADDVVVNP